jgi:hypothetical protein
MEMLVNRDPGDESGFVDPYEGRVTPDMQIDGEEVVTGSIFEDMHEQIKDIEYYKAETEAARSGQLAAKQYSDIWKHEWAVAKGEAEIYRRRAFKLFMALGFVVVAQLIVLIVALST